MGVVPPPEPVADFRTKVDAYGIGVRGGVITPQLKDEEYFRELAGLPVPGNDIRQTWSGEPVRRPITIAPASESGANQSSAAGPIEEE